ncbi:acyl-CoA thioesterase [Geopsychrobacter electrodiphilus]|uniref:acyl-CoA thioesterase n=1 Tax=Geopsychrobacter electrodiphilus TaxID=225196 RepID=UPI00037AAAF2|nr:thioesterase family protein [Geopsychrobacter electrodiphilus]
MPQLSSIELEVRYAETDQMGIVHHANYLIWFELARTRFCREAGLPYPDIEALGYLMIITQAQQNYRLAARYGETIRVSCQLDWTNKRRLQFGYRVERGDQLLTSGHTQHLWVKREGMRPCSLPENIQKFFTSPELGPHRDSLST